MNTAFERIKQGLQEAIVHAQGGVKVYVCIRPKAWLIVQMKA